MNKTNPVPIGQQWLLLYNIDIIPRTTRRVSDNTGNL